MSGPGQRNTFTSVVTIQDRAGSSFNRAFTAAGISTVAPGSRGGAWVIRCNHDSQRLANPPRRKHHRAGPILDALLAALRFSDRHRYA